MGTEKRFGRLTFASLAFLCLVLFTACGLDVFVYLDMPRNLGYPPIYTSSNGEDDYFWVQTSESSSGNQMYINAGSDFKCLGTSVYYRIYNTHARLTSIESQISSLDASTSSQTGVAEKLLESFGYKPLRLQSALIDPLVKATGTDQYVYIRLNDYGREAVYKNAVVIANHTIHNLGDLKEGETVFGSPRRYINERYGFNFCEDDTEMPSDTSIPYNPLPQSGDEDVDWQTSVPSEDEGKWFVDLYAVTVGRDATFTYSYSRVLHLGSITIDQAQYKK